MSRYKYFHFALPKNNTENALTARNPIAPINKYVLNGKLRSEGRFSTWAGSTRMNGFNPSEASTFAFTCSVNNCAHVDAIYTACRTVSSFA